MEYTKVIATPAEIAECQALALHARHTPVIAFSTEDALSGRDAASLAWDDVHQTVHKYALAHGLPEIEGYYGLDLRTGHFVLP